MSDSAALEKSGSFFVSGRESLGASNLGISSLGAEKEGGVKEGAEAGAAAFGAGGGEGATAAAAGFFALSSPLLPPNSDDPNEGPVEEGGALGALGAFFVAAL